MLSLSFTAFSTNGDDWLDNSDWLSNKDECTWATFAIDPASVFAWWRVLELIMDANNLNGMIPPEIALLSNTLSEYCIAFSEMFFVQ